jgi:hypothetical protein
MMHALIRLLIVLALSFLVCPVVSAQDHPPQTLRMVGLLPGGVRTTVTVGWATLDFTVTNFTDQDRIARVLVFYGGKPDVQYGRDVWVPAQSTVNSWLLVGPAPKDEEAGTVDKIFPTRELQSLLYDRTDGKNRLILPREEERIRSRVVRYQKRIPYTIIYQDDLPPEGFQFGQLPQPDPADLEALRLVRTFRNTRELPTIVPALHVGALPPSPEAFEGLDHFVLASDRLAQDPAGMRALRQWVERGGKVWVLLDRVDPDVLAPLLGDAMDFQLVDRISLTNFEITEHRLGGTSSTFRPQTHERPVDFPRVLLPPGEFVRHTIDGWPVWFSRSVGKGKIIITTLGPRGWHLPISVEDIKKALDPTLTPVPRHLPHFEVLGDEIQLPIQEETFPVAALEKSLMAEIGYAIVRQRTVVLVFAGFLVAALVLGFLLRRASRPELLGWLIPGAALVAAGVFVMLGISSRKAVAPTVAVGQLVEAVSGSPEAAIRGTMAVYRQESGDAPSGVEQGGIFEIDQSGLEGQTRRLIMTDMETWHWENMALPAGVRLASFRFNVQADEPIRATARFGPAGLEGQLSRGPFQEVGDALFYLPTRRHLAIALRDDGNFRVSSDDVLPTGQFLASSLLSDRQQRRQEVYREYLGKPLPAHLRGQPVLFAWANPVAMKFNMLPDARTTGEALLIAPLHLERPAPGDRVTVPGPLVETRRVTTAGPARMLWEANQSVNMRIRFQLPLAVLPIEVERARLIARFDAPSRRVTISGSGKAGPIEVFAAVSPLDPLRIEIKQPELLKLDEQGGLEFNVALSDMLQGAEKPGQKRLEGDEKWSISYLELEVTGKAKE